MGCKRGAHQLHRAFKEQSLLVGAGALELQRLVSFLRGYETFYFPGAMPCLLLQKNPRPNSCSYQPHRITPPNGLRVCDTELDVSHDAARKSTRS